jgi:hypothetical protein
MAKVVQDNVVITVSKVGRDSDPDQQIFVPDEVKVAIEQLVSELLGEGFVVEVL